MISLDEDGEPSSAIDMERVVADPAYRRRIVRQLRRDRLQAEEAMHRGAAALPALVELEED